MSDMGTRNLTAVYFKGKYRIAQYGQWDGYPEGEGLSCLHFARDEMIEELFRQKLLAAHFIAHKDLLALWKQYGMNDGGWVSCDNANRIKADYPQYSRDMGSDILRLVQDSAPGITLKNDIDFAADSLFCEWAWVIDLDHRTFEAYGGFNTKELTENDRFYFLHDHEDGDGEYHGVVKIASWDLDDLPDDEDFLEPFRYEDENDDDED